MSPYLVRVREQVGQDLLLLPSVSVVCRDAQGRVLLVRHADGDVWATPGGMVEPDERPVDAAVREMWEETGFVVEPESVIGVYGGPEFRVAYPNGDVAAYVMTLFACRIASGEASPDGDEALEIGWFSREQALSLEIPDWARVVLPDVFVAVAGIAPLPAPRWRPPAP
mgnify:CR=1 FL=1